ncbi:MAG TPA: YbjQ family protein [Candidatus Obscuribacterales bacterium]
MNDRPTLPRSNRMLLTTLEGVPGHTIVKHLGLVQGSTVRAKHVGRDIAAGFKNLIGGELKGYTELLQEARQEATQRMLQEASKLGANAVVNVRFATSSLTQGAAELFVYGTAVQID